MSVSTRAQSSASGKKSKNRNRREAGIKIKIIIGLCIIFTFGLFLAGCGVFTRVEKISAVEASRWLCHVCPRPHQVKIAGKVQVPACNVVVSETALSGPGRKAAANLVAFLAGKSTGTPERVSSGDSGKSFTVKLVLGGEKSGWRQPSWAKKLAGLPNADQSYTIFPAGSDTLVIAALSEQGLAYGITTLRQLIAPTVKETLGGMVVTFPLMRVTDWPDIAERGMWGHSYDLNDVPWFAEHKFNLLEMYNRDRIIVAMGLTPEGKGFVKCDQRFIDTAYAQGVKCVPVIFHLDQFHKGQKGLNSEMLRMYEKYPELMGKGRKYAKPAEMDIPVCASNPKFVELLTEWFMGMLGYGHVNDVTVWLSEWVRSTHRCKCAECLKYPSQNVSETAALVKAWKKAQGKYPCAHLWILPGMVAETIPADNRAEILAIIPPDIGMHVMEYNYSLQMKPLVSKALEDIAARGGWIGAYPLFQAYGSATFPYHNPTCLKCRLDEFYAKKVRKFAGYTGLASIALYDFGMAAAAEWGWNSNGRTPREFTFAYAVRKGMSDPDSFADWVEKLEPSAQIVHHNWMPQRLAEADNSSLKRMIRDFGTRNLDGWGLLGGVASTGELEQGIANCAACEEPAKKLAGEEWLAETRLIGAYLKELKLLPLVNDVVTGRNKLTGGEVKAEIEKTEKEVKMALDRWYDIKISQQVTPLRYKNFTAGITNFNSQLIQFVDSQLTQLARLLLRPPPKTPGALRVAVYPQGWGAE